MLDTTTFRSDLMNDTKQSAYVSIVIAETVLSVIGCVVLSHLSTRTFTFQGPDHNVAKRVALSTRAFTSGFSDEL